MLVGDPGLGKTALLEEICGGPTGMQVLRTTAVAAEAALPFAGLHAVLRPLLSCLERLPVPQQLSLKVALALSVGEEPDLLAVNAGTLTLLAEAAGERPVLVAVDDAHWLDQPSADALAFAARRLRGEEIAFLFTTRTEQPSAFGVDVDRIVLAPLAEDEARQLLDQRDDPVPPDASARMLELAAGNPLAILELPSAFALDPVGHGDTVTERVRQAFASRLEALPAAARLALVLAAAEPDPAAVRQAAGSLRLDQDSLRPAESAGLVRLEPNGITFRHPLVRSLAYATADPDERRLAHRALAEALAEEADRDRRAWHLAAGATEPDEELASLLDETADRAVARGGHAAAARALERGARLSRSPDQIAHRLTLAARAAYWAGTVEKALALLDEALATTEDPIVRAAALLEHASIDGMQGVTVDDAALLAQVGQLDRLDPDLATRLLITVVSTRLEALDVPEAQELVAELEAASRLAGPWWQPRGLATVAAVNLAAGDSTGFWEVFSQVVGNNAVTAGYALDLIWAEHYETARYALEFTLREGRTSGNQIRVIWNQLCLAHLELRCGQLPQAELAAAEAITLGEANRASSWSAVAQCALAAVHAWRGDADACRDTAAAALAAARDTRSVTNEIGALAALGHLALGLGRPEETVADLEPAARIWERTAYGEPSGVPFVPDLVEAYYLCGKTGTAEDVLAQFEAIAVRAERTWAEAAAHRCRGLLADADTFDDHFQRSLALLDQSPLTLDRARTQLAYGERLRRAGRRREARSHLRAAHAAFAAAGATPWAGRANAELQATGEATGPRTPDRRAALTPQEVQIAHLAAEGQTNKQIATQLYLSPKTIQYHLANTYRKLNIHSRAELARAITAGDHLTA